MLSRERLLRLGATLAERATTKRVRLLAQLLLLVGFAFVGLRVRSLWHVNHIVLASIDWPSLTGAFLLTGIGVLATGFIWLFILDRLGADTRPQWMTIFFQSQLAKYIPGAVWQYAGRIAMARVRGLPTRVIARSMPIELGASVVGAGVVSLFLLGVWGLPAAVLVAIGCLVIARTSPARETKRARDISASTLATPLYAIVWIIVGSAFWLTASGIFGVSPRQLTFYVGAFAAAWLVGLVAIYAPGGLGVREAVLVFLLRNRLGSADALLVAAVFRGILTVSELALAALSFASDRLVRQGGSARLSSLPPGDATRP